MAGRGLRELPPTICRPGPAPEPSSSDKWRSGCSGGL